MIVSPFYIIQCDFGGLAKSEFIISEICSTQIQGVSKRITRIQIIISNNENVLQLQNKLRIIKKVIKFHSP